MTKQKPLVINMREFFAGRPPPHNLDAEACVLNEIMERHSVDGVADILKPEHFYSGPNSKIYAAALYLAETGVPVDITNIQEWLRATNQLNACGGPSYLAQLLLTIPTVGHIESHAKIIFNLWRRRELMKRCMTAAAEAHIDPQNEDTFIEGVEASIFELSDMASRTTIEHIGKPVASVFNKIKEASIRGSRITGIASGFDKLDLMTSGLHPGDVTVVAGRPGMGKTAFVMSIAVNVASPVEVDGQLRRGSGVAVFSLEMPREQLAARMACSEGRVDLSRWRSLKLLDADWSRLTESSSFLESLPIYIDDSSGMTLLELRSKTRRAQAMAKSHKTELKLVVIDYLQLMSGDSDNREQEISGISRGLKRFAKENNVPVLVLSQLNRAVETRSNKEHKPQLSDLRESGAIEQDADNVLFLYRDDYYHKDSDLAGITEVIVAKQRNGPTGSVYVKFDASCTRFSNLPPADYRPEWEN